MHADTKGEVLKVNDETSIRKLHIDPDRKGELDAYFIIEFADKKEIKVKFCEDEFCQSFYNNPRIYDIAKPESCILIDIALAKGGPEAIAESFYNSMRNQLFNCEEVASDAVTLYHKGDENMSSDKA